MNPVSNAGRALPASPPLILLHPIGLRAAFWDEVQAALAPQLQGLALDLAGHGGQAPLATPMTLETLAIDAWSRLPRADHARFVLVGCSLGGMVAQAMALAAPQCVKALVLCNTSATLPPPARELLRERARSALADVASLNAQTLGRWFAPRFASRHPERFVRIARWLTTTDAQVQAAAWRAAAALDFEERLAALGLPTLVITGRDDGSAPPAAAEAMAGRLRAPCQVIEDAGHLAPYEQPRALAEAILGFVSKSVT